MNGSLSIFLDLLSETLASTIVVVAASLLLYNLTRNLKDRIARTSGIVLGSVTVCYISDVLIALEPGPGTFEALLRFQWVGLAFLPAAMFHLSDALLATTGLPSRGRRRRVIRLLYLLGALFLILASFTDTIIDPLPIDNFISLDAGPLFVVYVAYYVIVNVTALFNVERARRRCITRSTKRRMMYLEIALLTPPIGVFPYSVLLGPGQEFTLEALLLVNIGNIVVILMLLFLAYPLSFFGSNIPDRVVKTELLRFVLRGPATGLLALVVILFTDPLSTAFDIPGGMFMPFATVAVILLWQWIIALALPRLEQRLIYPNEDDEQMARLQQLSERALSEKDLLQLIEAILEAACDYLRIEKAFLASVADNKPELIRAIGDIGFSNGELSHELAAVTNNLNAARTVGTIKVLDWQGFWIIPLYRKQKTSPDQQVDIGLLGIQALSEGFSADSDEYRSLLAFVRRLARALDDVLLMREIYTALEGLLPQLVITRSRATELEYRPGRNAQLQQETHPDLPERAQLVDQVHAALRHYWGGPGLSHSRLLELNIVNALAQESNITPLQALRDILLKAIEEQSPEGERNLKSPEWTIYNILYLRFIERRKARETARRLYMSEANLYRKQNVAIEAVADAILKLEQASIHDIA